MNAEEKERKIKSYQWEIRDCRSYISELLTKEESGKIDTVDAQVKLEKTKAELKYYQTKLDKLLENKE